jgi:hypothetical protein
MCRAVVAPGVIVALVEGGGDNMLSEIPAITQMLRVASLSHPNHLVRELASMVYFQSGLQPGMESAAYVKQALAAIRTATIVMRAKSPADLPEFQSFVVDLAETADSALKEGGFAVLGTEGEDEAIARVRHALSHA